MRTCTRYLLVFLTLAVLVGALSGCYRVEPKPTARFEVTNWTQEYYEYFDEYSDYVYVYYKITNTGNIDIDYYEVWFEVRCADGSTFQDWTNGLNVPRGTYATGWTMINVAGKRATSVVVTRYELTSY